MTTTTREALKQAIDRMDRARNILTNGKPTPICNWGMLDASDLRNALAAANAAEAKPVTTQHGAFGLVQSIIHKCPALKLPQSFIEKLGMTAQIVPLKGCDDEMAKFIVDACNAALPAPVDAQPIYQMRRLAGGAWVETDADGETCLRRMPHWRGVFEFRTLYTATPAAHQPAKDAQIDRDALIEMCAKVCDPSNEPDDWTEYAKTKAQCSANIRAMKGTANAEQPAAKGWYCAHCQCGVDGSGVTFNEQHTVCGRVITDDCPPAKTGTLIDEGSRQPKPQKFEISPNVDLVELRKHVLDGYKPTSATILDMIDRILASATQPAQPASGADKGKEAS